MTYVHNHWRQLPKLLLHIPSYLPTIRDLKSDDCDDGVLKVTTVILKVTILTTALCGRTPHIHSQPTVCSIYPIVNDVLTEFMIFSHATQFYVSKTDAHRFTCRHSNEAVTPANG